MELKQQIFYVALDLNSNGILYGPFSKYFKFSLTDKLFFKSLIYISLNLLLFVGTDTYYGISPAYTGYGIHHFIDDTWAGVIAIAILFNNPRTVSI